VKTALHEILAAPRKTWLAYLHAVTPARGKAAASALLKWAGHSTTLSSSMAMYSANVPLPPVCRCCTNFQGVIWRVTDVYIAIDAELLRGHVRAINVGLPAHRG
jgi:hypothetical protein